VSDKDTGLRLLAQDAEDLKIISAAAQDAVAKLGDFAFDARDRSFTLGLNRYRWERGERTKERIRALLRFDGVLRVRSQNLRREAEDAVVELLAVEFDPGPGEENPGGVVRLILAGGGEIRLEVEQLEARLMDISSAWPTRRRPDHEKA
jgi:hypothetical protein